jgi:hypothetical protein
MLLNPATPAEESGEENSKGHHKDQNPTLEIDKHSE